MITEGHDKIIIATAQGMAICFQETDVRPMGREAGGVRGIQLSPGDHVIGAERADEKKSLLTVTEKGYGKRTRLEEYLRLGENGQRQTQSRGGKGMKNYNITEKTGQVVGCCMVGEEQDVMLIDSTGLIIRMPASDINVYRRDTQGVILMRTQEGNKVIGVECVDKE